MAKDVNRIFERMVDDMCSMVSADEMLDNCMSLSEEAIRHVPLRCRIIALGFVKHFTLDELNEKLMQQGCPKLYTRNFWEATLVFAFMHGYSFTAWKSMFAQCRQLYASLDKTAWFQESKITYGELQRYVLDNSDTQGDIFATQMHTRHLEQSLTNVEGNAASLLDFLMGNLHSFSSMREKARYYFCKYLYYYLNRRIENYFEACRKNHGVDEALAGLLSLKVVTVLRRNKRMPEEEKRRRILESAISCGQIFDEFNYFYFNYVSSDWAEILLDCYEDISQIPPAQQKSLAAVFRKSRNDLKKLDDKAVIRQCVQEKESREDTIYAMESSRGYGKGRAGEHALHKYIQGTLDIDRTALICFLIFLAADAMMPAEHRLTPDRMQLILGQCGYTPLDIENDFDWFVIEFLESADPKAFLIDVMTGYASRSENSFLYHLYSNSVHYENELLMVLSPKE